MMDLMKEQYVLVQSSRKVLLEYCTGISEADFLRENSSFGKGSIRNLLVHIANTYEFWIGKHALAKEMKFTEYTEVSNAVAAIKPFRQVDDLLEEFFQMYTSRPLEKLNYSNGGKSHLISPLALFTHVVTHEFHHKGQILSLSRQLGYTPVDTDIIR